ncbi:MAG: zinc ribbon domain-containing protein [ANME-2 cluster archaeon]|nr:MAG: zinc ribbon domain-containing protein [ANME-2 cluster archaeon]
MIEEAFISVAKENENISVQQMTVINIGSYVGEQVDRSTKIVDSMVQRSNIGAGERKCPDCGREVESNEKFCLECGTKL